MIRKSLFGIFKSKEKFLGPLDFKLTSNQLDASQVCIISTTFSRHRKTIGSILESIDVIGNPKIIVDPNIQDSDTETMIEYLKKTDDKYKHLIVLVPKEIRKKLMMRLSQESESDIPVGTSVHFKLAINSWKQFKVAPKKITSKKNNLFFEPIL